MEGILAPAEMAAVAPEGAEAAPAAGPGMAGVGVGIVVGSSIRRSDFDRNAKAPEGLRRILEHLTTFSREPAHASEGSA